MKKIVFVAITLLGLSIATSAQNKSGKLHQTKSYPKENLYSKDNDKTIELSVLSESEATNAFNYLSAQSDIPFEFALDGCYAIAHKMCQLLENKGIISGKAFIEGELYFDSKILGEIPWNYRDATVIIVKPKGQEMALPYIIDPTLFDKPVPYNAWKDLLIIKVNSSIMHEYFTNRFAYDPNDRLNDLTSYDEESISDMNKTNIKFKEMLDHYKTNLKNQN